jgi:hypothetical protein
MYFGDHQPPHSHAVYAEYEALVEIETLALYRGALPRRALAMVLEWAMVAREELRRNWDSARLGRPLQPIPPLE